MTDMIRLVLDDGSGMHYDSALFGTLQQAGDPSFISKDNATKGGNPMLLITFPVKLPDGSIRQAQAAMTVRNFLQTAAGIVGKYPAQNEREWPRKEVGNIEKGEYRGFKYEALLMEKFYLVSVKGIPGAVSIAGSEDHVPVLAKGTIDNWYDMRNAT